MRALVVQRLFFALAVFLTITKYSSADESIDKIGAKDEEELRAAAELQFRNGETADLVNTCDKLVRLVESRNSIERTCETEDFVAELLVKANQLEEGIRHARRSWILSESQLGKENWQTLNRKWNIDGFRRLLRFEQKTRQDYLKLEKRANAAMASEEWKTALETLEALQKAESFLFGEQNIFTAFSVRNRASCLLELGELESAELAARDFNKRYLSLSNIPHPALAENHILLGRILNGRGEEKDAIEQLNSAITVSESCGHKASEAAARFWLGLIFKNNRDWAPGMAEMSKAAALFKAVNDRASAGHSLSHVASIFEEQSRHAEAAEHFILAACEHEAAATPLEPFLNLLRSAELFAKAQRHCDAVKSLIKSSQHAATAVKSTLADDFRTEIDSVISAIQPLFESDAVVVEALEAWNRLTAEIASVRTDVAAWADARLSHALVAAPRTPQMFNTMVKWRTDLVRNWGERSRTAAFMIQRDHAWFLNDGRQLKLSTKEERYRAYDVALRLAEGEIEDGLELQRAILIVDASEVAEEHETGHGLRILEKNEKFLLEHLNSRYLCHMHYLRYQWLTDSGHPMEGVKALICSVNAMEESEDFTDADIRDRLAGLVAASMKANGDSPIAREEQEARRRLISHLAKIGENASHLQQLADLRRRLQEGGQTKVADKVLSDLFTIARSMNMGQTTTADLCVAIQTLDYVASEQEGIGLLGPAHITCELALDLTQKLPESDAIGFRVRLLGRQLTISLAGGQGDRVTLLAAKIKESLPLYLKRLSQLAEAVPVIDYATEDSYEHYSVLSCLRSAPDFLLEQVVDDIDEAIALAGRMDLILEQISDLFRRHETGEAYAITAGDSRFNVWLTVRNRLIDSQIASPPKLLPENTLKFVDLMLANATKTPYSANDSRLSNVLALSNKLFQILQKFQMLSDQERQDEHVLRPLLIEAAEIAAKLREEPMIAEREIGASILTACSFADFANGDYKSVVDTSRKAADILEHFIARSGGPPQEIVLRSQQLRSGLDPYRYGMVAAVRNNDLNSAFEFASRGGSLGSRIAWQRTHDLSSDATSDARAAWLPIEGRLTLEEQFAGFTSAGTNRSGRSSAVLGEQIAAFLKPDERYILISTLGNLDGSDRETLSDLSLFYICPKTHPKPGVHHFERGADSAIADERVPEVGVYVVNVVEHSAALQMGVRPGDIIQQLNGADVTPINFLTEVQKTSSKENVAFKIYRRGEILELIRPKPAKSFGVEFSSRSPREAERRSRETTPPKLTEARTSQVLALSNRQWPTRSTRSAKLIENADTPLFSARGQSWNLFKSLFPAELWEELKSVRKVYVSLPGSLAGLPLETLVVESPSSNASEADTVRWIDVGPQIVYLPFACPLTANKDVDAQPAKLAYLGVGDVNFTSVAGVELSGLPNTRREIESISKAFKKGAARVLVGSDASEEKLYHQAPDARILSIATHGESKDELNTLESCLILGATTPRAENEDPERHNGILTLRDLLTAWRGRLRATELTILSACQTGGGLVTSEDGNVGLPWGFLAAGSDAVIASQWPVDDLRTADLFTNMFTNRGEDEDLLSAFTRARRNLRAQHPDPHFWAPFIYISTH